MKPSNRNKDTIINQCPPESELAKILDDTTPIEETVVLHIEQCENCQKILDRITDQQLEDSYRGSTHSSDVIEDAIAASGSYSFDGYQVTQKIGKGGMGNVYLGQELNLGREVAIKVIHPTGQESLLARFERESKAAGQLRSDYIVPVYATGRIPDGRPYLVMPLIIGPTLKQKVESQISIKDNVRYLVQIAEGLQTAHDNGLIHRDVKPGNILIDNQDQRAKLTDFGLVRAEQDETLTRADVVCGTPEYMSPEQISPTGSVDHRSDLYCLGLVLYFCLTGTPPFRGLPLQILDQHRFSDPVPPRQLNRSVDFDLETICIKSIHKSPEQRYQSSQEFGNDLRRWLNQEPILARRPGAVERFSKFCQRNRGLVASTAAILVALLVGTTASTWFAIQANNAASTAENRLASAVASFQAVDPNYGASNGMTALQFLTSAKKNVSQSLSEDKEGRALILKSIADSMRGLGESKLALETYQEALDLYSQINAATSDEAALEIKRELATIHLDLSQLEPSLTLLNETENGFRALYGSDDRRTMLIQSIRIEWEIKKGNIKRAVELADELRLKYELLNLQNSEEGLINLKYLAKSYQENGQNDEAKEILKALLDEYSKSQGPDSLAALQIGTSLAVCYADLGDYPKAIEQGLEVLKLQQQKLEPDHPMIAINFLNLSTFYGNVGQYEQAMEYAEKSVDIATRGFGPKANETLNYKQTLATLQFLMGKPTEAQRNLEEILEFQSTELGYAHPDTLSTASNLSVVYSRTGQREKSLKLVTQLVDESTESLGQDHPTTLRLQRDLVVSLFYGGQKDKAIDLSKRMVDAHGRVLGDEHPDTLAVITNHGSLLLRLDRYEEAIGFLAEIHDKRVKLFGPENPTSLQTESELAFCHSKMGNHQIAIQKSWNVFETAERVLGSDHPVTLSYLEKTAKDHRRAQLYGDAEKLNRLLLDRRQNSSEESESDKIAAQYNLAIAQMLGNRLELALKNFRAVFKQEKLDTEFLSEDAMDTAIFILEIATRLEDLDVSNEVCNEVVDTIESPDCDLDDSIQLTGLVTVLESKVKNSDLESIESILSQLKQISIDDPWMDARIQAATAQSKLKSDPDLAMQQLQSAIDSLLPEGEPISKLLDVIPERGLWIPIFWMDQMVRASSNRAEPVIEELKRDRADLKVAVENKFMPLATSVIRLD